MEKILLSLLLLLTLPLKVKAQDLITASLIDHVSVVTQFQSGKVKLALTDSIIQIGSYKGKSIFDLQAGFSGDTKPESDEAAAANFIAGGFLKMNTLLADSVHFPDQWKFLNSIEHGPALFYDAREKVWRGSYQVGLAFGLNPK